ncbi:curli-like amyloid fiber formation chaperone CsgH [Burkholderia sp. S171]|uniref:curli-like amyloid fiber formation chaperone CsgH n=1 Tax=Burkholderia sp. S171 TaxID=1641860 RepID=UPI00131DD64C|nr:curli-like amyloid fiber formation chaperone CsgH [Burkholderia sp. S171]
MMPISDVQVSFDVHSVNGTTLVVPYVVAAGDAKLAYVLTVIKTGSSGQSNASQSGNLAMRAGERRAVSRLVMSLQKGDSCDASLALSQPGEAAKTFTADCSLK